MVLNQSKILSLIKITYLFDYEVKKFSKKWILVFSIDFLNLI